MTRTLFRSFAGVASICLAAVIVPGGYADAQSLSQDEIVGKLSNKKAKTRSLSRSIGGSKTMKSSDKEFLERVVTRGIKFEIAEKEKVYEIVDTYELPKLDFEINFEFGSKEISYDSIPQLVELSKALNHPGLAKSKVLLVGHTDAKGSDGFNQQLSEARANSVLDFLTKAGGVESARMVSFGYGEFRLKNTLDPLAAENRRVEIINLTN